MGDLNKLHADFSQLMECKLGMCILYHNCPILLCKQANCYGTKEEISKLQPMSKWCPLPVFTNTIVLEYSHAHLFAELSHYKDILK